MADIFLSYARENVNRAEVLAAALESRGWTVWWDRRIPAGKDFNAHLQEQLDAARCIVVLWSKASTASQFVRDEAGEGLDGRLVPVLIEAVKQPLGFRQLQAADLVDWDGVQAHDGFERFAHAIAAIAPPVPAALGLADQAPIAFTAPTVRDVPSLMPGADDVTRAPLPPVQPVRPKTLESRRKHTPAEPPQPAEWKRPAVQPPPRTFGALIGAEGPTLHWARASVFALSLFVAAVAQQFQAAAQGPAVFISLQARTLAVVLLHTVVALVVFRRLRRPFARAAVMAISAAAIQTMVLWLTVPNFGYRGDQLVLTASIVGQFVYRLLFYLALPWFVLRFGAPTLTLAVPIAICSITSTLLAAAIGGYAVAPLAVVASVLGALAFALVFWLGLKVVKPPSSAEAL
jgi:TIR domain